MPSLAIATDVSMTALMIAFGLCWPVASVIRNLTAEGSSASYQAVTVMHLVRYPTVTLYVAIGGLNAASARWDVALLFGLLLALYVRDSRRLDAEGEDYLIPSITRRVRALLHLGRTA